MRPVLFTLALALAGCVATAPSVEPPPPPVVRVEADPAPVIVRVETEPVEVVPTVPPPTPRLRVAQRSVYESDRVAVWALENGATVIYAWDDGADGYAYRLSRASPDPAVPGGASLRVGWGRAAVAGTSGRLDEAVEALADAAVEGGTVGAVALLHGSLGWEWVEPAVAQALGNVRRRTALAAAPPPPGRVDLRWSDYPALWAARSVAAGRLRSGDRLALVVDPASGAASAAGPAYALAPLAAGEIDRARGAGPDDLLAALDALFQLPGAFRPARPVSDARALADRAARVPADAVNALLARLARSAP